MVSAQFGKSTDTHGPQREIHGSFTLAVPEVWTRSFHPQVGLQVAYVRAHATWSSLSLPETGEGRQGAGTGTEMPVPAWSAAACGFVTVPELREPAGLHISYP